MLFLFLLPLQPRSQSHSSQHLNLQHEIQLVSPAMPAKLQECCTGLTLYFADNGNVPFQVVRCPQPRLLNQQTALQMPIPPLSAGLKHLRYITRCQAGTQQQQHIAQHTEHEPSPAVNFLSTLDYSSVLQVIRESRSCWWSPSSSGLLYSGLTDTFPEGWAGSNNKQQGLKQEMRFSKGKVHLEHRSSL